MCSRKVNTGGKIARPRAKFKPLLRKEKDKERGREREEKVSKLHCTESLFTWTTFGESITRRRFQPGDTQVLARRMFFCMLHVIDAGLSSFSRDRFVWIEIISLIVFAFSLSVSYVPTNPRFNRS